MKSIQIESQHEKIVAEILDRHKIEVYVFGSRAKGTARTLSDLDLCVKQKCDKRRIRKLHEDFEESNLPFKVDLIVWNEISASFQKQIEADLILFPLS